jgi:DNA excision repair protein ERCC-3
MMSDNPLIVQSDYSILVEVASPKYEAVRDALQGFAELVKAPEHIHTYKITPLSVWNARSAGMTTQAILSILEDFSKYPISEDILKGIAGFASRYGRIKIHGHQNHLKIICDDEFLAAELACHQNLKDLLQQTNTTEFIAQFIHRGLIKQLLVKIGFPAEDLAGYLKGENLDISLRSHTLSGQPFALRDYQQQAVDQFHQQGSVLGGSGVLVLPCGAGKTIIGMAAIERLSTSTLILTSSITAVRQWITELIDKTTLDPNQISEYSATNKQISPITVATYNILTHRKNREEDFTHMALFNARNWGLIIYDEVHLLPAPVFQVTASLQARRRLGLTATLVREDGREEDVFTLVGPKKADVAWKDLEKKNWIATAKCVEVRVPLSQAAKMPYAIADKRAKFRIAAESPEKLTIVKELLKKHQGDSILIIGMYIDQIKQMAKELNIPIITGSTPQIKRDKLFKEFREGTIKTLIVSKIANFAIDLPDASVAIQISGTFGSRQEEAQRLGRILRPKQGANKAFFYSLVTAETVEQDFAHNRQLFLCEQGYEYQIIEAGASEQMVA